jgi:hypothetical protein
MDSVPRTCHLRSRNYQRKRAFAASIYMVPNAADPMRVKWGEAMFSRILRSGVKTDLDG